MSLCLEGLSVLWGSLDSVSHFLLSLCLWSLLSAELAVFSPPFSFQCPLPPCPHPNPLPLSQAWLVTVLGLSTHSGCAAAHLELRHKEVPRFPVFPRRRSHCLPSKPSTATYYRMARGEWVSFVFSCDSKNYIRASQMVLVVKNPPANAGDTGDQV